MSAKTCRDCGNVLAHTARGCPRCAMNFEAEGMIDRLIWRRLLPGLVLISFAVVIAVYLWR